MKFFPDPPEREGMLFEPVMAIDVKTGAALVAGQSASPSSAPESAYTSGFAVWVGQWVLAVTGGTAERDEERVATALRDQLGSVNLPILFIDGMNAAKHLVARAAASPTAPRDLARAAGYVAVQASWYEEPSLTVELNGAPVSLTVEFLPVQPAGHWAPQVT